MNNLDAWLILNAVGGLGPVRIRTLVDHFGSPQDVLKATDFELLKIPGIPEHALLNILHFSRDKFLIHEYNLMRTHGVIAICMQDDCYPSQLRDIADPPVVLYIKGQKEVLKDPAIAIVGSRRASLYGLGVARTFAMELAEAGLTTISGLARGIDTAAHEGSLKAHGTTMAVLGNGLAQVYPPENKDLSLAIANNGALISEFPMETPPVAFNFPRRNRIISGISRGVVVVEAALKSGALITSDFALEQGKDVFAIPGQVGSLGTQGVHKLIKQGAKLTENVQDILEELSPVLSEYRSDHASNNEQAKPLPEAEQLTKEERVLIASVNDQPVHIDELAHKSGMSVVQAAMILFKLELKKLIKQLPGQNYQKNSRTVKKIHK